VSDAVIAVQGAAVAALEAHPALAGALSGVYDGVPARAAFPYISIAGGLVSDWSTKTETGREVRIAITIWNDDQDATQLHALMGHAEDALAAMARDLPGWRVASCVFLRSLIARDQAGPWSGLIEQRVRVLGV
jgi:Protein of unknown function (DUF3168)